MSGCQLRRARRSPASYLIANAAALAALLSSVAHSLRATRQQKRTSQFDRLPPRAPAQYCGLALDLRERRRIDRQAREILSTGLFDTSWYALNNPDVVVNGVNPVWHWLIVGWREKRDPSPLFNVEWYLKSHPDVERAEINPLIHYIKFGVAEGRDPNPMFDTDWYLESNQDVASAGVNPLEHFVRFGWKEGRNPSPRFDLAWYMGTSGFVAESGIDPLAHYLHFGSAKGLLSRPPIMERKALEFIDRKRDVPSYFKPRGRVDAFQAWQAFNADTRRKRTAIDEAIEALEGRGPTFSVIVPVYDPPLEVLDEAVKSVIDQSYAAWELVLVDDGSTDREVRKRLQQFAEQDGRIQVCFRESNGHISAATNTGASMATGDFLVFLDNDDKLDRDALALFSLYISENQNTDIVYSDDAKIDAENGGLFNPKFKPDWSPELLLSYCYISHLKALRRDLYVDIGGSRIGFEGSQDHDMLLRAGERARHIGHIPQILYHRRVLPTSTAASGHAKPYSFEAGRRAVEEAFARRGVPCRVVHPDWALRAGVGIYVPLMPDDGPSVALIIPTRNNWRILDKLLVSLKKTTYRNYRCYIIDNQSDDPDTLNYLGRIDETVFCIPNHSDEFSFSYINNEAVRRVNEDLVLFLNDDVEVIEARWLSQMVGWSRLPGVGAVGARLLYPDGRVQHGGVVFGLRCGLTALRGLERDKPGYLWYAKVTRNTSAVTAAVMLTPRALFLDLGGFDDENYAVAYNDVDYCARLGDAGYRVVYCGEAELFHHESYSRPRGDKPSEIAALRRCYGQRLDPLFNPHHSKDDNRYSIKPTVVPPVKSKKPIKVLFVTHNLNHEGAPNSAFELVSGLGAKGLIAPTIVSPQDGPLRAAYEEAGYAVSVLPRPRPLEGVKTYEEYEQRVNRFVAEVDLREFDLLYANTAMNFWAIDAAVRAGVPSVWNIRESESWTAYYDRLPSQVAARALDCFKYPYRVVFVANSTRQRWSPVDQMGNFEVIHNGLNLRRFNGSAVSKIDARAALGLSDDVVMILSVGTIAPRKGQHDLLEAYFALPLEVVEKTRLYFVGARKGEYLSAMKEKVAMADPRWANSVFMVGETGETDCYWNAADIFVCTSRMESYPRVILEAMAKSLPIITTPVFGVVEQVRENVNGRFYKPGDVEALSKQLIVLVGDSELRRQFSKNSRVVFEGLENFDSMVSRYEDVFSAASFSAIPPLSDFVVGDLSSG